VSALSAIAVVVPRVAGLDPRSLQHLAQIPGVLLLCWALVAPAPARQADRSASQPA
jgi:hypothetical protein